ncbi:MAG TPA: hypothetical protein PLV72_01900 [Candidatus Magasanikbacteria bacterium]|nr:hypothetical protein [Candidatus Magasanikbacteria bacterium]
MLKKFTPEQWQDHVQDLHNKQLAKGREDYRKAYSQDEQNYHDTIAGQSGGIPSREEFFRSQPQGEEKPKDNS